MTLISMLNVGASVLYGWSAVALAFGVFGFSFLAGTEATREGGRGE